MMLVLNKQQVDRRIYTPERIRVKHTLSLSAGAGESDGRCWRSCSLAAYLPLALEVRMASPQNAPD